MKLLISKSRGPGKIVPVVPLTIMIVDDIRSWREFVSSTVGKEPSFAVVGEVSGLDAVQMTRILTPHIVVIEMNLRGTNGLEIGQKILNILPNTKLIYLSSEFDYDLIRAAFGLGAFAYVLKSDTADDLISAIQAVSRNEIFVSSQLQGYGFDEV